MVSPYAAPPVPKIMKRGVAKKPMRARIVPNHSCLTNACFDRVHAVRGEDVAEVWRVHRER